MHLTIDPALALANAMALDLLREEIGVVNEPSGRAPGDVAIERGSKARRAGKGRPGDGPVGRDQVGQVPLRRQGWEEMRVIANDRPAARGALRGDCPVVRPTPFG